MQPAPSYSKKLAAVACALFAVAHSAGAADSAQHNVQQQRDTSASEMRALGANGGPAASTTTFGEPLSVDSLDAFRGGDSNTTNRVDIRGGVNGNNASDVITGDNFIQNGSFANASGISTVIQNTGNNVLIQNGTVVNVQFVDPGL